MPEIPPFRGVAFAIAAGIVLIWVMCAFGSNLGIAKFEYTNSETRVNLDIWYSCARNKNTVTGVSSVATCQSTTDSQQPCGAWKGRLRAVQAFYCFTGLTTIVCIVVGLLTQIRLIPALPFGLSHKILLIALAGLDMFWGLLSWAVAISIPNEAFCKDQPYAMPALKDYPNFAWGASPFFMLIAFLCATLMIVAAILVPQSGEVQAVDAAPAHDGVGPANAEGQKQAWEGNQA